MQKDYFISDMALEGATSADLGKYSIQKLLSYSIKRQTVLIKNAFESKEVGLQRGKYIIYDCPRAIFDDENGMKYLSEHLVRSIQEIMGVLPRSKPILTIGLGNRNIVADSLGEKVVEGVRVDCDVKNNGKFSKYCAMSPGVLGTTGIESIEIVEAIVKKINPCGVILVDALATSNAKRLCSCFQISSNGIRPGSGVGQDKRRIDRSVLGVATISIGVPTMLSLSTSIYAFMEEYLREVNGEINEYVLRKKMSETALSTLVVSPKDIDVKVNLCAKIISDAINSFNLR